MDTFITYDGLPISSGGAHHLSAQQPSDVYQTTTKFIEHYTDKDGPTEIWIEAPDWNLYNIFKYSLRFGLPGFDDSGLYVKQNRRVRWRFLSKNIPHYINEICSDQKLTLCIVWRFRFVDVQSKQQLPGQQDFTIIDFRVHNSEAYLRLSKLKSTMSAWFALPFIDLSDPNRAYINGMQAHLPFKFSKHHWRLWKLSKNGIWKSNKLKF
ncbi:hypothetical protein [Mucilaginibacter myungsuensis]|uniref:Uncharacterized protein n=1 Tax=Mucilaginibacter myungsuensis TaxID=649104 RepID=A0A929L6G0_9SPHI|nr:hypothetical protein [Mucilaginibacter myungsuensis]MBE9664066.1 hypothetical protein [Mucilaginibacter myungsuensis]MDN3601244.1 hypothetical protein [Mucilaginibacter myungsuensis]